MGVLLYFENPCFGIFGFFKIAFALFLDFLDFWLFFKAFFCKALVGRASFVKA